jgi:cytolysin (calcineurin-like family phosphatase)
MNARLWPVLTLLLLACTGTAEPSDIPSVPMDAETSPGEIVPHAETAPEIDLLEADPPEALPEQLPEAIAETLAPEIPDEVAAEIEPEIADEIATEIETEATEEVTAEITEEPEVVPPALVEVPRTTLADGFHVPLVPPGSGEAFSLVVASDPQIWWNFIDSSSENEVTDALVEAQNQLHIDAMNALIAGEGLPEACPAPLAAIMNGDLTEYGRWAQWDAYYRLYEGVNAPIFDGLGNHDYENNNEYVGTGCGMDVIEWKPWRDACDAGSTQMLWGQTACEVADSITELWHWCATDTMRRMRYWISTHAAALYDADEGSAAYSWELGDVHFVQVHNSVDYEVPETQICSALAWLMKDLKNAFLRDKKIVLLMHRPVANGLKTALQGYQYNIVGIFYGHIHAYAGYDGDFEIAGVPIPTFYSGSVQWNIFSLAQFAADHLTVTVIDSNTGAPVHHASAEAYDNLNGAHVAAPFTYVYPTHECPSGQIPTGPEGACEVPVLETPPIELCY